MVDHTGALHQLGRELFASSEWERLWQISLSNPLDLARLTVFDRTLGGPCITTIADRSMSGGALGIPGHGVGRYDAGDRAVFRPLHYCSSSFMIGLPDSETRAVVQMSAAHLEALVKLIAETPHHSLGPALKAVRNKIDETTRGQIGRLVDISNDAKHRFDQAKDTHLFPAEDAVLTYFVCRRLAQRLYPLVRLSTDLGVFSV